MRMITLASLLLAQALPSIAEEAAVANDKGVIVTPSAVNLTGKHDRAQILVAAASSDSVDERRADLTHAATYVAENPEVVHVDERGRLTAIADGQTEIVISVNEMTHRVGVKVEGTKDRPLDFLRDVRPIFNKAGCAAGACHAAQFGKGGFKLSVFGFDPDADYEAITRSSRGRRVNFAVPEKSLLLRKPTMKENHGGGARLEHDSIDYKIVRDWIDAAAPPSLEPIEVDSLQVFPAKRVGEQGFDQQLRVVAQYSDGTERDVTAVAIYDAIDKGIVSVNERGRATTIGKGQTAVMVRYDGQATICTVVVP
jgi:hypothetical protein